MDETGETGQNIPEKKEGQHPCQGVLAYEKENYI